MVRSTKKLKLLFGVPDELHFKVKFFSYICILFSSPWRVPKLSFAFWEKIGRSGKGSFTEKAKIIDRGSICSVPENTGSKPQYEPFLFSVACS